MPDTNLAETPIATDSQPFNWRVLEADFGTGARFCFEVQPSAGAWKPFFFAIPAGDRAKVVSILPGEPGQPPDGALVANPQAGPSADGALWCWQFDNAATSTQSYFVYLSDLPAVLAFGQAASGPQYRLALHEIAGEAEDDDEDPAA
ncbi:MAG: hypothetical protein FJZ01_08105 [Candidatus Sericytochromatia bacterium]|nr:hypothetical protein [Candidatus Tanganyikabacteria bacterium]